VEHSRHSWSEGKGRYGFLDLYRGIIVLFMLEGHVFRELLTPAMRTTPFFTLHEIFHGVTAPGFLFGAGFAFAIAAQRRWEQAISFSRGFFRRSWRALSLIIMGYALHLPFLSLQKTIAIATSTQWNAFLLFDVLQCIGVGLLLMRFLLVTLRREWLFIGTLVSLLFTVVYITPLLWVSDIESFLPLSISSAVNGLTGSPFPLFPFLGFLIAGTCVSWLFLRATQNGHEDAFIQWLMFSGIILFVGGAFLDAIPIQTYKEYLFWSTSPNYFWMRLGILLLMLGSLWYIEDISSAHGGKEVWMPKWLTVLGVESLFVYITHLIITYGWVINVEYNLRWWWGSKLNIAESFLVFIGLTLAMIFTSFIWRTLKKKHPILMKGVYWWVGFCIAWSFFFNPY
jgi:uncharacterized membrane protein